MFRFTCPACGKVYKAKEDMAGKATECKSCGIRMMVPGLAVRDGSIGEEPQDSHSPPSTNANHTAIPNPDRAPESLLPSCRYVRLLRRLILIEAATTALFVTIALFGALLVEMVTRKRGGDNISTPEVDALLGVASLCFVVIWLPLTIVSWVGLYKFHHWARSLYLALSVGSVAFTLAVGVIDFSIQWGLVSALSQASGMLSGGILAIVYYSPVAERFGRERSQSPGREESGC